MARSMRKRTVATRRSKPTQRSKRVKRKPGRHWSGAVTRNSDALDLESSVFSRRSPRQVALSLQRSAERSRRRKGTPYQSAMSMLNFYINRAGKNLPASKKRVLARAKDELRKAFGRE
ncbi:MAG TPA: DUF3175 domain-containing protein [Stellaceae bacterium]|nr:DUF3175 domain-containing protein [Stellaceae bacterium]